MKKLKQQLNSITNQYEILDDSNNILLSVQLEENNQIVIKTDKEVWAGPINLLTFTDNKLTSDKY